MSEAAVFNLIHTAWLPVRRRSGTVEHIQPWRVTEGIAEDPFVAFAWPRPDFNGAAHEFLIGLLSTASAPEDDDEWEDGWQSPPAPDVLEKRFARIARAFDFDGPGTRFLQDIEQFEVGEDLGKVMSVASLLIEAPGKQRLDNNADLFVKRDAAPIFCRAASAMALYTLTAYAPRGIATGGRGHRQSLRKAGPLTTLIIASHRTYGDTLWGRLWPNVETKEQIDDRSVETFPSDDDNRVFPWLCDTRISSGGRETTPADVHPLQVYWGMPRRIRLIFEEAQSEPCTVSGFIDVTAVRRFHIQPYGINYSDGFEHPLTPYYRKKENEPTLTPATPDPGGLNYRQWPGHVIQSGDRMNRPAQVIRHWFESRRDADRRPRLVAFGYFGAVRSEWKPRSWIEGEMPLWILSDAERRSHLEEHVRKTVKGAEAVAHLLTRSVRTLLYDPSSGSKPSQPRRHIVQSALDNITARFFRETEPAFYRTVTDAVALIQASPDVEDPALQTREYWATVMAKAALRLFDEYAPTDRFFDAAAVKDRDIQKYVKAQYDLTRALSGHGKEGRSLFDNHLGIVSPETVRSRRGKKESA